MNIPSDPVILLSFINTQLRDNYPSLSEFCNANDIDEKEIADRLSLIGYEYNHENNQFF